MKKFIILILFFIFYLTNNLLADRLKDLVSIAGIRSNQLLGYGIVIGLNGTGDSTTNLTLQSSHYQMMKWITKSLMLVQIMVMMLK